MMRRWPPIVAVVAIQIAALLASFTLLRLTKASVGIGWAVAAAALMAAALTWLTNFPRWWVAIQLCLAPLAALLLYLDWSPWVYLALFALLAMIYWSIFATRVPLYMSGPITWQAVERLLPPVNAASVAKFIDVGCGLGGLLAYLAGRRADMQFVGIELAPLPALLSKLRFAMNRSTNVQVLWGDFWNIDFARYDTVFAFLSPVPMPALWSKARREMRAGSLLVSCAFDVPGQAPDEVIELGGPRQTRLLVWRMPGP